VQDERFEWDDDKANANLVKIGLILRMLGVYSMI